MSEIKVTNHVEAIKSLLLTLKVSERVHALIVESSAGWGKTTSILEAMKSAGVENVRNLGSYSTPLHFFNFMSENPNSFIILDDCSGIFSDQSAMAILKAATWPHDSKRILKWGSTSGRANVEEFEFTGKLIIVCNSFPNSADGDAVRSRSFPYKIEITVPHAKELLEKAATDANWFKDIEKAKSVAEFLTARLNYKTLPQLSYRTLHMGYELAFYNEATWKDLLGRLVSVESTEPEELIRKLSESNMPVKEQIRIFEDTTGLKRRSFFNYRKELGL